MFLEQGVRAVRMDDIAAQCGISKRTLYENFSDREDLIRQSLRYHMEKFEVYMTDCLKDSENVLDELWRIFSVTKDFHGSGKRLMQDLIKFYPKIFEDFISQHYTRFTENNRSKFERGIEEGLLLEKINAPLMARLFSSYLYGVQRDFADYDFSGDYDNNQKRRPFQYAIMYFLRGMATEKGREYIDSKLITTDDL